MSPGSPSITSSSAVRRAWLRWKSIRLPWRKRFLVGQDLHGNTFWEFRDALTPASRLRRIVQYPTFTHSSDVSVSPQWHQWLRHVRPDAPSLDEQAQDVLRVRQLKILAQQADQRWADKESVLDVPGVRVPAMEIRPGKRIEGEGEGYKERGRKAGDVLSEERDDDDGVVEEKKVEMEIEKEEEKEKEDPWKQARRNPGEEWQPQTWGGRPVEKKEKRQ